MQSFIISFFIRKYGAETLIRMLIEQYLEGFHLSKNPRKRISDDVSATRID